MNPQCLSKLALAMLCIGAVNAALAAPTRSMIEVIDAQGRARHDLATPARMEARARAAERASGAAPVASDRAIPQPAGSVPGFIQEAELRLTTTGDGAIADRFGRAVDATADLLVIGAPDKSVPVFNQLSGASNGAVYVYRKISNAWIFEARLQPKAPSNSAGFGRAIATDGNRILIGAPGENLVLSATQTVNAVGAAYVFSNVNGEWLEEQKLVSDAPAAFNQFGTSVDLQGNQLIIGEPERDQGSMIDVGYAHVFVHDGVQWQRETDLQIVVNGDNCKLGSAVALQTDLALAGAPGCVSPMVKVRGKQGPAWQYRNDVTSPSMTANSRFGEALDLDGQHLVVGAPLQDLASTVDVGAVVVYELVIDQFNETQVIQPSLASTSQQFGSSADLQVNRLLVGAPGGNFFEGLGWVFDRSGTSFTETAMLENNDGGFADLNGLDVALLGDEAFLGADLDNIDPNRAQGSVKRFALGTSWAFVERMERGNGANGEQFGFSVDVDGPVAIVGAYRDAWDDDIDDSIDADDRGSATIFRRTESGWVREAVLRASDGFPEDRFGVSVAIDGDRAAVGAYWDIIDGQINRGSVYVFERINSVWTEVAHLSDPDGLEDDFLGYQLDLRGDVLVVGAPGSNVANLDAGAALVFVFSAGSGWQLQQKISDPSWPAFGLAGLSIALDAGRLAIGAPDSDVGTNLFQGLVHLYRWNGSQWQVEQTLQDQNGAAEDGFGFSVALQGNQMLIGVPGDSTGAPPIEIIAHGSAQVFQFNEVTWMPLLQGLPPTLGNGDGFGTHVAASSSRWWVGAPRENEGTTLDRGAVYGFDRSAASSSPATIIRPTALGSFLRFGRAIASDFSQVLVGAPDQADINPREGAVYVYRDTDALFVDGLE